MRGQLYTPKDYDTETNSSHVSTSVHGIQPAIELGASLDEMKDAPIRFHVYSEGTEADFTPYIAWANANNMTRAMRLHLVRGVRFSHTN